MSAVRSPLIKVATLLGVVLLSLLTLVLLAEGGLRLAARISLSARDSGQKEDGARTFLAVGDSWTFGNESGDANKYSYPAQLQAQLDRKVGPGHYQVVNRGVPGNDSAKLRRDFPSLLKQVKPAGVVIQIGGLNWLGTDRMGKRAVPGWLVSLGERQGASWLAEMRVVRLAGMLLASGEQQGGKRSEAQLETMRAGLRKILNSREALDDKRGYPDLPLDGCLKEGEARPERFMELLIRQGEKVTAANARDPAWRPETVMLQRLILQRPGCTGGLVALAEGCLHRGDLSCARGRLIAAKALLPHDLRLNLALIQVMKAEQEGWTVRLMKFVDRVWARHRTSVAMLRNQLELELDAKCNLCAMNAQVDNLLKQLPGTPWLLKLKKYILGQIKSEALWELRDRELREDLAALVAMAREAGVKVLLLNYADQEIEGDPCSREFSAFYHAFSAAIGVGLVDIKGLLIAGSNNPDDAASEYSDGGHPNARGYRKIAAKVMARMEAEGWL